MNATTTKYSIRIGVALLIHFFFLFVNLPYREHVFYGHIDVALLICLMVVVIGIWEIIDIAFRHFELNGYDYGSTAVVLKIVGITTLITLPLVTLSSLFIDLGIMQWLGCNCEPHVGQSILQGQLLAWLIIASKVIKVRGARLQEIEKEKAIMQKNLLMSQYEHLKVQINPHFLFNSFSVLRSLIETDPKLADKFLGKLSKLYRHILEDKDESMRSLKKELAVLDDYIFLLRTRYGESLVVEIDIPDQFLDNYVPGMALQMLIENAIKHNNFCVDHPLHIRLYVQDNYLVVSNRLQRKDARVTSTKIGLENIKSRYGFQTNEPVIVEEASEFFTVKLPILTTVRLI